MNIMNEMTVSLGVYIFIIVTIAFIVKGLAGFGDPLISNPLLSLKIDNKSISPAMLPVSVVINTSIVIKNRKNFEFRKVLPIALCVMAGVIPGTLLLKTGSPWILKVLLGCLIIGLGIEMLTRDTSKSFKPNIITQSLVSFASGMTGGLFGINLLFLIYLERTAKNRGEFRGSVCFVFFLENIFRTIVYLYNGIFTKFSLMIAAITVPSAILGMWIGGLLDRKIDEKRIRTFIIIVFILGGVSTMVKALITKA